MNSYRVQGEDESSDSDSCDSENEGSWKRRPYSDTSVTVKTSTNVMDVDSSYQVPNNNNCEKPRKKVNNVWCHVLQERSLTDEFGSLVELKKKPNIVCDRSCESYDYTRKALDTRVTSDEESVEMDKIKNGEAKKNLKKIDTSYLFYKKKKSQLKDERLVKVAQRIAHILNEPKKRLIYDIVCVIGPDKAQELLKKTEDIESNGGMKIMNGSRRRTPGGVYIQLVKQDPVVDSKDLEEIFMADKRMMEKEKKLKKKKIKKKIYLGESSSNAVGEVHKTSAKEMQENMDLELNTSAAADDSEYVIHVQKDGSDVEEGEIID